jgi:hypothetical protein
MATWAQMAQAKEQNARRNLDLIMNMPGLSEEQKRKAIDDYYKEAGESPWAPRVRWPKETVPGQVITPAQPAVPGTPAQAFPVAPGIRRAGETVE